MPAADYPTALPAVPPPEPPDAEAAAIVLPQVPIAGSEPGRPWGRLIPAWIVSGVVHAILLTLLLLVTLRESEGRPVPLQQQVVEGQEEADPERLDLTASEIGIDPDVPTNYNVTRLEDYSVPGPADPTQPIGIVGAPDGPPDTLPPPAGFNGGQGGGLDGGVGRGGPLGLAGGYHNGLLMMPGGFGGRSGATREQLLKEGGGNTRSEAAVALGLRWLSLHQGPEGQWNLCDFAKHGKCNCGSTAPATTFVGSSAPDVVGTAFALLPFLGAGETHRPALGTTHKYDKHVSRGLKYLVLRLDRNGCFSTNMYVQGIASLALCEAYGMTADPMLRGPAQRAIEFICKAQNDRGGWDYGPRGPTPDTSIGAWQLQALKSGQMGGLVIPKETLQKANRWLDDWAGDTYGSIYGYRQPNGRQPDEGGASPQTMVAAGLLCRQYLGWGVRNPGLTKGADWLIRPENLPLRTSRRHLYYWYYATQVLHHQGGPAWKKWNPLIRDLLIDTQDKGLDPKTAHQKGSWESNGDWWTQYGGRIMTTSMSLLTLEVYYRHLPLYRKEMGGNKDFVVQ
jgi:hypothetical protein